MGNSVPHVLVALKPAVYAEAVARSVAAAGYTVTMGGPAAHRSFDAVVTQPDASAPAAPVMIVVGPDARAVIRHDGETGFVTLRHPADVANILCVVLTDRLTA